MKNKIFTFLILIFFINNYLFATEEGMQKLLDNKIKYGKYKKNYLDLEQIIIDILQIDIGANLNFNNKKIKSLFENGEILWEQQVDGGTIYLIDNFKYRDLCQATINYYIKTNQTYIALAIYKKLLIESRKHDFMEVEFITLSKYIDTLLSLGLLDLSHKSMQEMKEIVDEYFVIDTKNIENNDLYSFTITNEYQKYILKYNILFNENLNFVPNDEFDFLLNYYDYKYMAPFVQLDSRITTEEMFKMVCNENNIFNEFYYANYETLFLYAKIFAINGDIKRTNIALVELQKALKSNGTERSYRLVSESNIWKKELHANSEYSSPSKLIVQRIPLKYNYLSSLYTADINYHLGDINKAKEQIIEAEKRFKLLVEHYKKLPPEYQYIDGVIKTKRELLTIKANILEKQFHYADACDVYDELIVSKEDIRASLPINLRKSYFRGYAKDAYLGLIRSRAKIYEKEKTKTSFDNFLVALNLLSSRQLKDLKATADIKEQNLQELQASMGKEDLIYIIFDVSSDIVVAGISKSEIFASVVPKNTEIDKELYAIKNDLVKKQIYNREKLLTISSSFINPISKFKDAKNIHLMSDGVISILPLEIYPLGKSMVFNNYSVDYLTTLSFSKREKESKGLKLLAIADPMYDNKAVDALLDNSISKSRSADISGYFVRLPETKVEVEMISKKMDSSKLLLGKDAKESTIKTMPLEEYKYIHFATHGILGGEIPDMNEPALVLAQEDGEDSLLSASEIAKLKLDASLVVLSACNSGSGKYFRGEGVTGIARAFKVAGSDEIIASLWPVDSFATKKLMELFYDYLAKGNSNSKALYLAKQKLQTDNSTLDNTQRGLQKKSDNKEIVNNYSNPYFWSGFILIN